MISPFCIHPPPPHLHYFLSHSTFFSVALFVCPGVFLILLAFLLVYLARASSKMTSTLSRSVCVCVIVCVVRVCMCLCVCVQVSSKGNLMYIFNYDKQNYPFCRFILLVDTTSLKPTYQNSIIDSAPN